MLCTWLCSVLPLFWALSVVRSPGCVLSLFIFCGTAAQHTTGNLESPWEKEEDRLGEGGSVMILVDYWSIGRNASTENLDMSQ